MTEICRFNCKVREHKQGQQLICVPKIHRHNFRPDQPVTVAILQPQESNKQVQLKKEDTNEGKKKI